MKEVGVVNELIKSNDCENTLRVWGAVQLRHAQVVGSLLRFAIVLFAISFTGFTCAFAAMPAKIRAQEEQGFARIVLSFTDRTLLPSYEASINSGVLKLAFPKGIDVNVDDVPGALKDYISIARRDPDGTALRFALKQSVTINSMEAGEKLFIDLLPLSWTGMPPALPKDVVADLARRADAALKRVHELEGSKKRRLLPEVRLNVGVHPTFSRLVFDWNVPFKSSFVRNEDMAQVIFNHDVKLDISQIVADPPNGIKKVSSFNENNELFFRMRLDPTADLRAFREGQSYVIDVTPKRVTPQDEANQIINEAVAPDEKQIEEAQGLVISLGEQLPSAPVSGGDLAQPVAPPVDPIQKKAPPAPKPPMNLLGAEGNQGLPVKAVQNYGNGPELTPPETLPDATPSDETVLVKQNLDGVPQPRPKQDDLIGIILAGSEALSDENALQQSSNQLNEEQATTRQSALDMAQTEKGQPIEKVDKKSTPAPEKPIETSKVETSAAVNTERLDVPENAANTPQQDGLNKQQDSRKDKRLTAESLLPTKSSFMANRVNVEASRINKIARLAFEFNEATAAAVFRRGDILWLVFDSPLTVNLGASRTTLGRLSHSIKSYREGDALVVQFELVKTALASLNEQGNSWILSVGDKVVSPSKSIDVERRISQLKETQLKFSFKTSGKIHRLKDIRVGDEIIVATGLAPVRGIAHELSMVPSTVLRSLQGVAVVPMVDGLALVHHKDGLILKKEGGLAVSRQGTLVELVDEDPKEALKRPGLLEFATLTTANDAAFLVKLRALEVATASAEGDQLTGLRQDMARFYLAHGFAEEAIGMLGLAAQDSPEIANDPSYLLMQGAAQVLAHRSLEAKKVLDDERLKDNPDAAVWLSLADAQLEDWAGAYSALSHSEKAISRYPLSLQADYYLAGAQTQLELGNYGDAQKFLSFIEPQNVSKDQSILYDFLRAKTSEALGQTSGALEVYNYISGESDGPIAAKAALRSIRLNYQNGSYSIQDAIKALEGLAASWRGDKTELRTLQYLAELQTNSGQYRSGFEAMAQAIQSDPDSDITRDIQKRMAEVFADLFLRGGAAQMDPVTALALFYDFRDLVPAGRQGDLMVRRLANRLVDMDLLDQAAAILQHQIDHRLKGAAKAQIAADLAVVHLLNRKPEKALRVLSQTRQGQLPDPLLHQRNIVEARALAESGRPDLALELVRNMHGTDVDRLRADTLWEVKSWRKAGEQLEKMHGTRWAEPTPLNEVERHDILRAAVAYAMGEDRIGIQRLTQKYGPKMLDSPQANAFDVATRSMEDKGVEFLKVAKSVSTADSLDSFLDEYRRHYLSSKYWRQDEEQPQRVLMENDASVTSDDLVE
ncbi:tetratricopeptide repeat protein [Polycladidibacter stylochi]|uniref:tetratricopeptide repeat protein n=1 Tax=Polycladidibacter stylochi TaxID=1807766 RepID=UPI00082C4727|nr:tetratricopeptide repeat protein [Pseudovibrio stylochi]